MPPIVLDADGSAIGPDDPLDAEDAYPKRAEPHARCDCCREKDNILAKRARIEKSQPDGWLSGGIWL